MKRRVKLLLRTSSIALYWARAITLHRGLGNLRQQSLGKDIEMKGRPKSDLAVMNDCDDKKSHF